MINTSSLSPCFLMTMHIGNYFSTPSLFSLKLTRKCSAHKVCRTWRTSLAKIKNVGLRAPVKFNQMPGEEVKMSGEAQKNFMYTAFKLLSTLAILNVHGHHRLQEVQE